MSKRKDIAELIESRLSPKQLERYEAMRGYYTDRIRKITKAAWVEAAIAEIDARESARQDEAYLEYKNFEAQYNEQVFDAEVLWFDKLSGEGMVRLSTGLRLDLYACNIEGKRTWYPGTACVYYTKGQSVSIKVKLYGMGSPIFAIGMTPGSFDGAKWDSLDKDRLAFKCNEAGQATNGLFR